MHHSMTPARHSFAARRSSSRMSFSRRPSEDGRRPSNNRAESAQSNVSLGTQLNRRQAADEAAAEDQNEEDGLLGGVFRRLGFGASRDADEEEGGDGVSRMSRRSFTSQRSRSRPHIGRRSSSRSNAPSEAVSDGDASPPPSSDENWGYSSNDDDGGSDTSDRGSFRSENNDLVPPSSRPHSPTSPSIMPLLPADHVFHNDRPIDSDDLDMVGSPFPSTAGSKSKQVITLPDEDLSILFVGYATVVWKEVIWWIGCILTAGILGLIGRWVPRIWVRWVGREKDFTDEEQTNRWVLVEVRPVLQIFL
jgi:cation-transporting ATPase 13A2